MFAQCNINKGRYWSQYLGWYLAPKEKMSNIMHPGCRQNNALKERYYESNNLFMMEYYNTKYKCDSFWYVIKLVLYCNRM